jgi:opacity protein-like surface antigen
MCRMKHWQAVLILTPILGFLVAPLQAGEPVEYKQVTPPPPPQLYGVGFYGAIDMGANLFQNRGDETTFTERPDPFTVDTLTIDPKNDVGFFGGIKLGYVFLTGLVRPTIEGDFFYNGFRGGADFTVDEVFNPCPQCETSVATFRTTRSANVTSWINTGAFMANFILRFAFGRFQPYAGAGVGGYYAESAGVEIQTPRHTFNTGGGRSHADLAWQVVGGSDYYWTPKFSTFIEYKFLNYTSTQVDTRQDRDLKQHLLGAGMRVHF